MAVQQKSFLFIKKHLNHFNLAPIAQKVYAKPLSPITNHGAKMANKGVAFYIKIINSALSVLAGSRNGSPTFSLTSKTWAISL